MNKKTNKEPKKELDIINILNKDDIFLNIFTKQQLHLKHLTQVYIAFIALLSIFYIFSAIYTSNIWLLLKPIWFAPLYFFAYYIYKIHKNYNINNSENLNKESLNKEYLFKANKFSQYSLIFLHFYIFWWVDGVESLFKNISGINNLINTDVLCVAKIPCLLSFLTLYILHLRYLAPFKQHIKKIKKSAK